MLIMIILLYYEVKIKKVINIKTDKLPDDFGEVLYDGNYSFTMIIILMLVIVMVTLDGI